MTPYVARGPLSAPASESYGTLATLVVLVIVNAALTPHFVSWSNLWNIGRQVTTTIWVGMGMTFVISRPAGSIYR